MLCYKNAEDKIEILMRSVMSKMFSKHTIQMVMLSTISNFLYFRFDLILTRQKIISF